MAKDIVTTVYTFDELDEKAKKEALEWASNISNQEEWWESVYEDAKSIGAKIEGFELDRGRSINFKLEWDAVSVALAIRENHGESTDTHKLAVDFISEYDEYHGVNGKITLDNAENPDNVSRDLEIEWEDIEIDFTSQLGECYLSMLDKEFDYINSDEYLIEIIEANEYTFTADGKRFG